MSSEPVKINPEELKTSLRHSISKKRLAVDEIGAYVKQVEEGTGVVFKNELTKLGVTSGNLGEASQETMTALARLIESKDKAGLAKLRKHLTDIRDANAATGKDAIAELKAAGISNPESLIGEIQKEVESHLTAARAETTQSIALIETAKAGKASAQEAATKAEQRVLDFIGHHNTAPESSELAKALRKIPHKDGVLTMATKGAELDEATLEALAGAVQMNANVLKPEVDALIKSVKDSRGHVAKMESEIKLAEEAATKVAAELRTRHPHLEGHNLLEKAKAAAEKAAETAGNAAEKIAKKGGKTKWIVGGALTAVALGAVYAVTRSNKSHAQDELARREMTGQAAGIA